MIDHTSPTPDTDAFICRIDDTEICIEQIRAQCADWEREREWLKIERDAARRILEACGQYVTDRFGVEAREEMERAAIGHCIENIFKQELLGEPAITPPPAKIGDVASNIYTGHRSTVVEALARADGRIYATLESGARCVLPSANWISSENAEQSRDADLKRPT